MSVSSPWRPKTSWTRAKRIVQDDALAETNMHLQAITDRPDPSHVRAVIDLALRITDLGRSTGATAAESTAMALRIIEAFKIQGQVDVTYDAITISIPGGAEQDPITAMRRTRALSTDYNRLSHVEALVDDLTSHTIDIKQARSRFNDIAVEPRVYRRWVVTASAAMLGGAIALLQGGGPLEVLFTLIACALVDIVVRQLGRRGVPGIFVNLVGGMIPTTIGVLVMALWPTTSMPSPSIIVGAGIVGMLAGIGLTGASQDALDGYYITSGARMFEAVVMTTGIVLGVLLTLWLGLWLGLPSFINPITGATSSVLLQVVCAGVVAMAFGMSCYTGPRTALLCFVLGVLSQLGQLLGRVITDYAPARAVVSALLVGAAAALMARHWRVPMAALIATGIVPQVPGSTIYRGVYYLLDTPTGGANTTSSGQLVTALLIGVALAIGTSAGAMLVRPLALPMDRGKRLALLKAWRRNHVQSHHHA